MATVRVRHHTGEANLDKIMESATLLPSRGWGNVPAGVHVELEPFGTTMPSREGCPSPKADFGLIEDGAFVEFDAPPSLLRTSHMGPRISGIIPTPDFQPFSLEGLNPIFVKVRRRWWEFWRTKPES